MSVQCRVQNCKNDSAKFFFYLISKIAQDDGNARQFGMVEAYVNQNDDGSVCQSEYWKLKYNNTKIDPPFKIVWHFPKIQNLKITFENKSKPH